VELAEAVLLSLWLYPTISTRELLCLPKSGPAVTGAGDLTKGCSGAGSSIPLLANDGYADLFCFTTGLSRADVSTLNEPVGGRALNWKPLAGGLTSTGVAPLFCAELSWPRLAEIRARREIEASLGSLLVLGERTRPSGRGGGGVLSAPPGVAPDVPDVGSSVCMKQHLLPYGQEPDTQNVLQISVLYFGCRDTLRTSSSP